MNSIYNTITEHWKNYSHEDIVEEVDGIVRTEQWRRINVPHFCDGYLISDFGRIKSLTKNKIRKSYVTVGGYLRTTLIYKNEWKCFYPHILVALTFVDNKEGKTQVNHKKGVKWDNRAWELEWVSSKENIKHAFETGLSKVGENHGKSKLSNSEVLDIFNSKDKLKGLMNKYGVCRTTIKSIRYGNTWGHLTGLAYKKRENKSRASLSNKDVLDIFCSTLKTGDLMKKYKISSASINNIKLRKSFHDVTIGYKRGDWKRKHEQYL